MYIYLDLRISEVVLIQQMNTTINYRRELHESSCLLWQQNSVRVYAPHMRIHLHLQHSLILKEYLLTAEEGAISQKYWIKCKTLLIYTPVFMWFALHLFCFILDFLRILYNVFLAHLPIRFTSNQASMLTLIYIPTHSLSVSLSLYVPSLCLSWLFVTSTS